MGHATFSAYFSLSIEAIRSQEHHLELESKTLKYRPIDSLIVGEEGASYGRTQLWSMAAVYGIMGVVLLGMTILFPTIELWTLVAMIGILGMLFVAFGLTLYSIYTTDREEHADPSELVFSCKHCGKRFSREKIWRSHERSCVEMEI
jgi:hypothetical protein